MAKPKRKLLPKGFQAMLENGDLDQLKAVFDVAPVEPAARVCLTKQREQILFR